jgi:hypothetical protein
MEFKRAIQDALAAMSSKDVTVGDILVQSEGVLSVEFLRGTHTKTLEFPIERLEELEKLRAAVRDAIGDLTQTPPQSEAPPEAVPETRFEDSDRKHRAGTKFD